VVQCGNTTRTEALKILCEDVGDMRAVAERGHVRRHGDLGVRPERRVGRQGLLWDGVSERASTAGTRHVPTLANTSRTAAERKPESRALKRASSEMMSLRPTLMNTGERACEKI
jgi:hypothetical protein